MLDMDFFSAASDPATDAVSIAPSDDKSDVSDFAQAIADRFGHSASIFTARLPQQPIVPPPIQPSAGSPAFPSVAPADLDQWLQDSSALIVDIRPHAAHSSARIPHAISLCVPSTLLKRPLFSLQKLCAMLPSASARTRFSAWRSSSRIIVYDADSQNITDTSNISGLLRKFMSDGFQGELAWLRGGFQAIWKDRRDIVDTNQPDTENEDDDDDHSASHSNLLRTRHLPMAAFSLSSTAIHCSPFTANKQRQQQQYQQPQQTQLGRPSSQSTSSSSFHASNPFFDAIRQNVELNHGVTGERIPLQLPRRVRRRIKDLPFPWLQDIAKRAANAATRSRSLSDTSTTSDSESGDDLSAANVTDIEEGKEALASQFYKIELAEQKRLMGIMDHHSRESGQLVGSSTGQPRSVPFPFSITAGVEKGTKNRYRHIWPFEHARVRLHHSKDADDDYVNASYVQPLGTRRRYIATQGPLPATFTDFWTLCWEQNVHVIVMLTREVEGAMVKCGSYWTDTDFGPLRLKLVSTEGLAPPDELPHTAHPTSSSQAPLTSSKPKPLPHSAGGSKPPKRFRRNHHYRTKRSEIVKRTFELMHTGYPEAKPRKIVHLQYLEWPDMTVPDDPRGVLGLIKQVDEAVRREDANEELVGEKQKSKRRRKAPLSLSDIDEKTGIAKHALGANNPVLLHCSAGVGRTGGFIAVDAVLDAIRREIRSKHMEKKEAVEREELERQTKVVRDTMDVDANLDLSEVQKEEDLPRTVAVEISSGRARRRSSDQSAKSGNGDKSLNRRTLVVHLPLAAAALAMEVDQTQSEQDGTPEDASSPSPPPPDRIHKFNEVGTREWAKNVRDETGVGVSETQVPQHAPSKPYASTSSSRTGSTPELAVLTQSNSNGSSSSSSANGDRTSRSNGSGGVYMSTSTSLGTSVSGASTSSSKEKLNVQGSESETGGMGTENMKEDVSSSSRSSSSQPQQEQNTTSSLSSCAMSSEGEAPSRSRSPADSDTMLAEGTWRGPLQLQHPSTIEKQCLSGEGEASDASAAGTVEPISTTETVAGGAGGFDYTEPRPLHANYTPPLLTTFEDPIWKVVQDMREQRMSLCQSLRQYVFVHAAVIEGSLMVLDEEKETAEGFGGWRAGKEDEVDEQDDYEEMRMRTTPEGDDQRIAFTFSSPPPPSSSESGTSTPSISSVSAFGHSPLPSRSSSRSRSRSNSVRRRHHHYNPHSHPHMIQSQPFLYSNDTVVPPSFAPSYGPYGHAYAYGKRPSSPTELLKEDKKGEVMLSKRPSIERKRRNTVGKGDGNGHVSVAGGRGSGSVTSGGGAQERGTSAAPL